jgi:hypothetical protein
LQARLDGVQQDVRPVQKKGLLIGRNEIRVTHPLTEPQETIDLYLHLRGEGLYPALKLGTVSLKPCEVVAAFPGGDPQQRVKRVLQIIDNRFNSPDGAMLVRHMLMASPLHRVRKKEVEESMRRQRMTLQGVQD